MTSKWANRCCTLAIITMVGASGGGDVSMLSDSQHAIGPRSAFAIDPPEPPCTVPWWKVKCCYGGYCPAEDCCPTPHNP